MAITYIQKQAPVQKKDAPTALSVLDSSSQSEALQHKTDMANNAAQREEAPRPNNTGMPDNLKSGIESLSGFSMDDVRVHYNSSKPATVQALAYTQGTDIHVAPGQEKHLPHEAWHVAQQMAGRVSPTTNINGMPVNDNAGLEHEADVMGEKAITQRKEPRELQKGNIVHKTYQKVTNITYSPQTIYYTSDSPQTTEDETSFSPQTRVGTRRNRSSSTPDKVHPNKKQCLALGSEVIGGKAHAILDPTNPIKGTEAGEKQRPAEEIIGGKTHAILDPTDPIKGTGPGSSEQKNLMDAIHPEFYTKNPFIKGHLLNHNLGGLGIAENMAPLTENANALHEMFVEQGVKNLIYNGYNVDYTITANVQGEDPLNRISKTNPPITKFLCNVEVKEKQSNVPKLSTTTNIISGPAPEEVTYSGNTTQEINEMIRLDKKTKPEESPKLDVSSEDLFSKGWGPIYSDDKKNIATGHPISSRGTSEKTFILIYNKLMRHDAYLSTNSRSDFIPSTPELQTELSKIALNTWELLQKIPSGAWQQWQGIPSDVWPILQTIPPGFWKTLQKIPFDFWKTSKRLSTETWPFLEGRDAMENKKKELEEKTHKTKYVYQAKGIIEEFIKYIKP